MVIIKSSSEIGKVFAEGRRVNTPDVGFIIARNDEQHDPSGRVAFIAGKKLGNAVWRNRAKRRMRSLCHAMGGGFPGYDVLFVARRNIGNADFHRMEERARQAFKKIGVVTN